MDRVQFNLEQFIGIPYMDGITKITIQYKDLGQYHIPTHDA